MDWSYDLPLIWTALIGIAVFMYVLMDGFDLGVGILFPFARGERERDIMMNSVAPIWDGNETWLILGGGGLLGTFPIAYAVLLEALYMPLIVMLLALIFRGVAFEFRFKSRRNKHLWSAAFALGSVIATFAQGVVLGTFIQGFEVDVANRIFTGTALTWISPFALVCGAALVAGYALLGATWLIMKTEEELQAWSFEIVAPIGLLVMIGIGIVSLLTPFINPHIYQRWFAWPNLLYLSPVPVLVVLTAFLFWRAVENRHDYWPFLLAMALFALSYLGIGISMFPHIIPYSVTIWEAASPPMSQGFLLVGALVLLPVILAYTGYSYWVFRGKVADAEGYH
ncbi:cytochrome bd-I ubiquinol oxidase subunit 2 apoprotein [Arboricoccus pini]|uniref:Cytochrome bd-I ubiquinol oxidase subunit 2 apoprotein n=1 Tax=Arboricoccus pini TaxID=1963835 RepID=A0A212R2C1_9PROT|nr:cytochrome d ubiquinol oxidase subunit II [Arboricoccus pini]SNB66096.1 cytochrome bd-I ubiquinol oxidase subunit 2 apoprotein [Arboricoccus pini]